MRGDLKQWRSVQFALVVCLTLQFAGLALAADETGFVPLFDGKTLTGWEGDTKTFRVADGAIVGGSLAARIPRNEFLCSKDEYGNFELRLEFKILGAGANGGVQFRSQRIPNHHEVKGYQADLGEGWYGSLYDESRRNKLLATASKEVVKKALKPDDWNDYTVRCEGPHIQIWINGEQTVDYTEPDGKIEQTGRLGLQIHGGPPAEAWYKELRIKKL